MSCQIVSGRMPSAVVRRLNTEVRRALAEPDTKRRFSAIGIDPAPGSPEDFAALIHSEIAKWAKVVRAAGIKPE